MQPEIEEWRIKFQTITRSRDQADRLVSLITAYTKRSHYTWQETAELTERDLLNGKSVDSVVEWFANIV